MIIHIDSDQKNKNKIHFTSLYFNASKYCLNRIIDHTHASFSLTNEMLHTKIIYVISIAISLRKLC